MREIPTDNVDDSGDEFIAIDYNSFASEVMNLITSSGQSLDAGSTDQLLEAMARYVASGGISFTDTGSPDNYFLSPKVSFFLPTELIEGAACNFLASSSNSGASTLTRSGSSELPLLRPDGTDLEANDIVANQAITVRYNSSFVAWVLTRSSSAVQGVSSGGFVGEVIWGASPVVPAGWLLCDGSSYSEVAYPDLFSVIGNTYGSGSAGQFRVPLLDGRSIVGRDNMGGVAANRMTNDDTIEQEGIFGDSLGNSGGTQADLLGVAATPAHSHECFSYYSPARYLDTGGSPTVRRAGNTYSPGSGPFTSFPTETAHNNMDSSLTLLPWIRF